MVQLFLGTGGQAESRRRGEGVWCVLMEELDTEVADRGDKWTCWQTASVVARGRETVLHLIMRWPCPKTWLLLLLTSESFPSEILHTEPDRQRHTIHVQSKYKLIFIQRQNYSPLFLFHVVCLTFLYINSFLFEFTQGKAQQMIVSEFTLMAE